MHFHEINNCTYYGEVEAGKKCLIERDNKSTYLVSHIQLTQNKWISLDIGLDIHTNEKVWGAENGALQFNKVDPLNTDLIGEWIDLK